MNRPDKADLITKALRDTLSAAEENQWQRLLQADPDLRHTFAEEQALDRALHTLPDLPISTNFTARTLHAALHQPPPKPSTFKFRLSTFINPFAQALAAIVGVCAIGLGLALHHRNTQRADIAQKLRSYTEAAQIIASNKVRPEELFQNFEAIRALPTLADNDLDLELLLALQK